MMVRNLRDYPITLDEIVWTLENQAKEEYEKQKCGGLSHMQFAMAAVLIKRLDFCTHDVSQSASKLFSKQGGKGC